MFLVTGYFQGVYTSVNWTEGTGSQCDNHHAAEAYADMMKFLEGTEIGPPPANSASTNYDACEGAALTLWDYILEEMIFVFGPAWVFGEAIP